MRNELRGFMKIVELSSFTESEILDTFTTQFEMILKI